MGLRALRDPDKHKLGSNTLTQLSDVGRRDGVVAPNRLDVVVSPLAAGWRRSRIDEQRRARVGGAPRATQIGEVGVDLVGRRPPPRLAAVGEPTPSR